MGEEVIEIEKSSGLSLGQRLPRRSVLGLIATTVLAACGIETKKAAPQAAPEKEPAPTAPTETQSPFAVGRPTAPGQTLPPERPTSTVAPTNIPTKAAEVVTGAPTRVVEAPPPTRSPEPTLILEPKPEIFSGLTLSSEFLEKGPGRGGGGVSIDSGAQPETQSIPPIEYGNWAWRRELDPSKAIDKLKILVAQGAFGGVDGSSFHFLNLDPELRQGDIPLRLFRFTLDQLPGGVAELKLGDKLTLKKGTHVTVIGSFNDEQGVENTVITFTDDKDAAAKQGIPDHYLAVVPTLSSSGGGVSLEELARQDWELVFKREGVSTRIGFQKGDGKRAEWESNQITAELAAKLEETVRKDLEPQPTVPKEEILQIETLETTWNPEKKRWEYYDTQLLPGEYRKEGDDRVFVGWWNEQDKKFEVDPNLYVLRARWRGLYVPWTAEQAETEFEETVDPEAGKGKIPIAMDFLDGEIINGATRPGVGFFGFRRVAVGKIFYAPFRGKVEKGALQNVATNEFTVYHTLVGRLAMPVEFKSRDDYIAGDSVQAGEPLVKFSHLVIPKARILNPNTGDYQIGILIGPHPDTRAWDITFRANLLVDEKGRFVYIGK